MLPISSLAIPSVGLAAAGLNIAGILNSASSALDSANSSPIDGSFAKILGAQKKIPTSTTPAPQTKTEQQIKDAARGFERTLVRQMLTTVRSTSLRGGDDQSEASKGYLEIADDKLADTMVAGKGIGFATKVADQMLAQPNVKALIEAEKKAVNSTNGTTFTNKLNSVINQYQKAVPY